MRALDEILAQTKSAAHSTTRLAVREARTWDVFKWVAIVLLTINLLTSLLLCSGIRSEIDMLKADREASADRLANLRSEVELKISKAKAELSGDLAAAHSGQLKELRKISTAPGRSTPPTAPTQSIP